VQVSRPRTADGVWSAERAAALLDAIPSRVAWWDADARIRYANAEALIYARRSWAEVAGANLADFLPPDQLAAEGAHFAAALAGSVQQYDREVVDRNGNRRYEQIHLIPLTVGGRRDGFVVHVMDGTARVEAQRQAQRAHERLALRRARHAVATAMQQTVSRTITSAAQFLADARCTDPVGREDLLHAASDGIDDAIASLREAIAALRRNQRAAPDAESPRESDVWLSADSAGRPGARSDARSSARSGARSDARSDAEPTAEPGPNGRFASTVAMVTPLPGPELGPPPDDDATRGLDCELLDLILDHVPAAVTTWDPEYYNTFANRPAARWYGFGSGAEMRGWHGSDLLGADAYEASLPHGEAAMRGRPTEFIRAVAGGDGRLRHAQVVYRAHVVRGELVGAVALVFDVTSRVEAEAELHESLDRSAVLTDRERIAEDLHDLVIQRLYATNLLLNNPAVPAEQRIADALDALADASEELRTAVRDLDGSPVVVEPRAAIGRVLRHAAKALPTAPVLRWRGADDLTVPLDLVSDMLAVVNEAVSNAVRHGHPHHVTVEVTTTAEQVRIRISDDGIGLVRRGRRSGLANLAARARRRGGRMEVRRRRPAGTIIDWWAPIAVPGPAPDGPSQTGAAC
jgi:PAS domain S-box-containing protein